MENISRQLTKDNIDETISQYLDLLKTVPINIQTDNVFGLLHKIKREKMSTGPYPNVSLFEAANRMMTDLTILYGIRSLLTKNIFDFEFDNYLVEFGNESFNKHDIISEKDGFSLFGEAFNVAESFFQTKKSSSLKKLRKSKTEKDIILIIYNSDAIKKNYLPKSIKNEFHLSIKIDL